MLIFSKIDDPIRDLGKEHQLNDTLITGIKSVICEANSWNEMELYTQEKATRYYMSSLDSNEKVFQNTIRSHWAIENKLYQINFNIR